MRVFLEAFLLGISYPQVFSHHTVERKRGYLKMKRFMKYGNGPVLYLWMLLAAGTAAPQASQVLSNDDIIQMVKAGLSASLITSQIRSATARFDLSTAELIRLSKAGVPENVIAAMRNPGTATPGGTGTTAVAGKAAKVPDGEKVRLLLMEEVSSATAQEGDRVNLTVAEDVKVGEDVIIAKGAAAAGKISHAKKKGMLGEGGKLTMSLDQVKCVDGQNVRIRATASREGDDKLGKTVAVFVLAGPFAVLVKGKDVTSPKGTEYAAYLDETKNIVVSQ